MEKGKLKDLINRNYMIIDSKSFFESLKETSLLEFRKNIQMVQAFRPSLYLENKVLDYYDELLDNFDKETSLFGEYNNLLSYLEKDNIQDMYQNQEFNYLVDEKMIVQLQDYNHYRDKLKKAYTYLKKTTNQKVSEIVIDGLFGDTIYNVWINIREMLRFNNSLKQYEYFLNEDKLQFYKTILEIDKVDCKDKIELYYRLKDKNIPLILYEDLRKAKEISYQKLKKQLFSVEDNKARFNKEESERYSTPIYDLDGESFYMLVRCMKQISNETSCRRNCYTVIADYNMDIFSKKGFIYGYKNIEIECILHIFEKDAYSSSKDSSNSLAIKFVNRIINIEDVVGKDGYNEIQIVNKRSNDSGLYKVLSPDYLVVFDKIESYHIVEAKRLNIPIIRINKFAYIFRNKNEVINLTYEKINDDYTDGAFQESNRLIRRLYKG